MSTTTAADATATLYTRAGVLGEAPVIQYPESSSREGDAAPPATTTRRAAREALPLPPDPYPGLRPFTDNESRLFCGRVMERLRLLNLLAESDFVAVLGSSGSGKSSLVLSGLIPDIRSGKLPGIPPAGMEFATFRPGSNPYARLAAVLFQTWLGKDLPDPFFIEEKLRSSPLALAQLCTLKERTEEELSAEAYTARIISSVKELEEMGPEHWLEGGELYRDLHSAAVAHAAAVRMVTSYAAEAEEFPCVKTRGRLRSAQKHEQELSAALHQVIQEVTGAGDAASSSSPTLPAAEVQRIIAAATAPPQNAGDSLASDLAPPLSQEPTPTPEPPRSLLIVVDQFEEIFRFANLVAKEQDEDSATRRDFRPVAGELDEAQAFITLLLTAARQTSARVRVVITMRSDFFKHCEVFDGLPEAIAAHQFITPRMSREQMEDAIQMPLEHFGSEISEVLVNTMLNDVHGEDDQLPVLQHALARMWHQAKAQRPPRPTELTLDDYRRAGRLQGAMNLHGDRLIQKNGLAAAQVGRFFRCLGDFDPTSGHAIRRPRTLVQISAESGLSTDEIRRIATAFAHPEASFITVTPALPEAPSPLPEGDIILDLTHECLLRKWQACTDWMRAEKREGDALKNLSQRMDEFGWEGTRTLKGDHLSPGQYQRLSEQLKDTATRPQAWAARYGCDLAKTHAFLAAEKKHAFWQRWRWPLVGAAFLLVILVAALAMAQAAEAKAHARMAEVKAAEAIAKEAKSREQEANYIAEVERQRAEAKDIVARLATERADAEAKAAADAKGRAEAEGKVAAMLDQLKKISDGQSTAQNQAISMVGDLKTKLAEAQAGKDEFSNLVTTLFAEARLDHKKLSERTQKKLDELGLLPGRRPASVDPLTADLSLCKSRILEGLSKSLFSIALLPEPDEKYHYKYRLLAGGKGGLWSQTLSQSSNAPSGAEIPGMDERPSPPPEQLWKQDAAALSLSTLPDSSGWITATNGGPEFGLSIDGGRSWSTINTRSAGVSRVRIISGQRLVYGTINGKLGILNVGQTNNKDAAMFGSAHTGTINDIVASPDGTLLVASGDDNLATLWRIQDGLALTPLDLGKYGKTGAPVRSASFSKDGRWLLLPSGDKSIQLCLLHHQGTTTQVVKALNLPHDTFVNSGSFSPDGRWIATTDISGKIYIWRSIPVPLTGADPQPVGLFTGHTTAVSALAWSPNSAGLASADQTGAVIVWRLQIGATVSGVPLIMPTAAKKVSALAWSPDSSLLATADLAGTVQVHPLTVFIRARIAVDDHAAAGTLQVNVNDWPSDFADPDFLSSAQAVLRHSPPQSSALARVLIRSGSTARSFSVSPDIAARLGPASDSESEVEISISKLTNQKQPLDNGVVRLKTARFILNDQVSRDASGAIQLVTYGKGKVDYAGVNNETAPALVDWIKTFLPEGMKNEAEAAALDYFAAQTDSVSRWIDPPTAKQDKSPPPEADGNPSPSADPKEAKDLAKATAAYNALQAYLRWMVSYYGPTPTAKRLQIALGDAADGNSADGIIGPATKGKLMQRSLSDVVGLLQQIDKVSLGYEKSNVSLLIAKSKQAALAFAKSFLSPATAATTPAPSTFDQRLIDRARSAIGKGTRFESGKGGADPAAANPLDNEGRCDTSGFIAWVIGQSRRTTNEFYLGKNEGWMNVLRMRQDVLAEGGFLSQINTPAPGCLALYGSSEDSDLNAAIVTEVTEINGRTVPTKVISCTSNNWTQHQDAILELPADDLVRNPATVYGLLDSSQP